MRVWRYTLGSAVITSAAFIGCGSDGPGSKSGGAGTNGSGAPSSGGTSANGGSSTPTSGGANATGGTSGSSGGAAPPGSGGGPRGGGANAGGTTSGGTGNDSGGKLAGGASSGGTGSGGKATAGSANTGGTSGGAGSGGTSGGGSTTGGMSGGGASGSCVPAACGTHKWPCWKMPNPASSGAGVPNPQSYSDLGNGAVRDNVTCLVWEKANPAPASGKGNWTDNFNRCAALATGKYAGFDDWRMPTRVEMASITDVTRGATGYPAIFTVTSGYYLTGSFWYKTILTAGGATAEDRVWGYGRNGFTSNAIIRSDLGNVTRCVSGNGAGEAAGEYAKAPANHYAITGSGADAVVSDNYTGLSWQQTFSTARMAWSAASSYCSSQTTGGLGGWRVPTLNELASTVNEALVAPAIDRTAFPNTIGGCGATHWYWAAEASKVGGTAWGISYCDGYTGWNAASAEWNTFPDAYVRCVR